MSLSSIFPTVRPSLLLNFAKVKRLDPRITFTRSTTATYYDGETEAKAEENFLIRSQEIGAVVWATTNVTVASDDEVAPDGTTTADKLTASAATGDFFVVQNITSISGQTYVASVFAKAGTNDYIQLAFGNQTGSYANFDITSGAGATGTSAGVSSTAIQDVGNGWFRCSVVLNSSGFNNVVLALADSDSMGRLANWTAAGTETVYLWGAQLEQRSSVTSYTPTTTQPITNYIPVLLTAPANVARFDHNPVTEESLGLLIEEQRTNLITYSEDFSNAAWTKTRSSIISNTIVAPDGTLTGDKLVENTDTATHIAQQTVTVLNGTTYTYSLFAKAGERNSVSIRFGATDGAYFNLVTGVVTNVGTATGQMTSVGNGWYRCAITFLSAATSYLMNIYIANGNAVNYTSNGYSGIYIWGAQLEAGAFPTSYIPTVASTVTRNADLASMTGSNFTSWFNNAEGAVYVDVTPNETSGASNMVAELSDGTYNNRVLINGISSNYRFGITVNNTSNAAIDVGLFSEGVSQKIAGCYKLNDIFAAASNGNTGSDSSSLIPIVDRLTFGVQAGGGGNFNGTISKLAYYPERLPNEQLQALTGS